MSATAPAEAPLTELTIVRAAAQREAWLGELAALAARGGRELALDLSQVAEIDGAGVQLLVALDAAVAAHGARLRLVAPSGVVREALATLGARLHVDAGA